MTSETGNNGVVIMEIKQVTLPYLLGEKKALLRAHLREHLSYERDGSSSYQLENTMDNGHQDNFSL